MTRHTALVIHSPGNPIAPFAIRSVKDPTKFRAYIVMESPGLPARGLVTGVHDFDSADMAISVGRRVIESIRAMTRFDIDAAFVKAEPGEPTAAGIRFEDAPEGQACR